MANVYIKKVNNDINVDLSSINPNRKEYLQKLKGNSLIKSYQAWLVLKDIVLKEFSLDIDKLMLKYNKNKKPYFDEFEFNISHSDEYICVGVASSLIGVDIQLIDKSHDFSKIAKRINASDNYLDFYKRFSGLEAYNKKLGFGLKPSLLKENINIDYQQILLLSNKEYVLSVCCNEKINIVHI